MAYDSNNVFARIVRGELPAHKVLEDAHTLAFMDTRPQCKGHTLVIPKAGAETIFDIEPAALAATIASTQKVARAVKKVFAPEGVMIAQLNGAGAGQTVPHLHFHVLPRYDGPDFQIHFREPEDPQVLADLAAKLRAALD